MNVLDVAAIGFVGGLLGGLAVDARFWWTFVQEIYYHHPGNHPCRRVGCCR